MTEALAFSFAGDVRDRPRRTWLVRGIIPSGSLAILYGEPGAGKSMVAAALAAAVAEGAPWLGIPVHQGASLYVSAERGQGTATRLDLLNDRAEDGAGGLPLAYSTGTIDLFHAADGAREIVEACRSIGRQRCTVRLIIIDTLARVFGGDENSTRDMGRLIANLDLIRCETGAAILVIHHAAKGSLDTRSNSRLRLRGSSALLGAADVVMSVRQKSDQHLVRIEKANDAQAGRIVTFKVEEVTISAEDVTNDIGVIAIAVTDAAPSDTGSGATPDDRRAKQLADIIRNGGGNMSRKELLVQAKGLGIVSDRSASEQVRRALSHLRQSDRCEYDDRSVSLLAAQ